MEVIDNSEFILPETSGMSSVLLSVDTEGDKPKFETVTSGLFCAAAGCTSNKFDTPDIPLFRFPAQKKRYIQDS